MLSHHWCTLCLHISRVSAIVTYAVTTWACLRYTIISYPTLNITSPLFDGPVEYTSPYGVLYGLPVYPLPTAHFAHLSITVVAYCYCYCCYYYLNPPSFLPNRNSQYFLNPVLSTACCSIRRYTNQTFITYIYLTRFWKTMGGRQSEGAEGPPQFCKCHSHFAWMLTCHRVQIVHPRTGITAAITSHLSGVIPQLRPAGGKVLLVQG